jgi:hypothetical protein
MEAAPSPRPSTARSTTTRARHAGLSPRTSRRAHPSRTCRALRRCGRCRLARRGVKRRRVGASCPRVCRVRGMMGLSWALSRASLAAHALCCCPPRCDSRRPAIGDVWATHPTVDSEGPPRAFYPWLVVKYLSSLSRPFSPPSPFLLRVLPRSQPSHGRARGRAWRFRVRRDRRSTRSDVAVQPVRRQASRSRTSDVPWHMWPCTLAGSTSNVRVAHGQSPMYILQVTTNVLTYYS